MPGRRWRASGQRLSHATNAEVASGYRRASQLRAVLTAGSTRAASVAGLSAHSSLGGSHGAARMNLVEAAARDDPGAFSRAVNVEHGDPQLAEDLDESRVPFGR